MRTTSLFATTVETGTALQQEAVSLFLDKPVTYNPASGGVSNIMSFITTEDGIKYILRIYNNGKNSELVKFEHKILNQLPKSLSFQVPRALPSLKTGETHMLLSSGDEACIFEVIPGSLPKLQAVEAIGEASGELNTALANVKLDMPSQTPPYYEIFKVHHAINRDLFYSYIASSVFDKERKDVDTLVQYVRDIEAQLKTFHEKKLPEQLIHGDLHYDNVLILEDGTVSGLLDFEYCGFDWRAMELAICLSKYAGEDEPMTYFEPFVKGFAKKGVLTESEIESVADLIVLRILSNVVFFVGRAITGEDDPEMLISRAGVYGARINWIYSNKEAITNLIKKHMLK